MFFKDPRQLLEVFSQLEEQNLFLIQNCQETEEGLEELKGKFRDTQERMEGEVQNLRDQIEVGCAFDCFFEDTVVSGLAETNHGLSFGWGNDLKGV